MDPVIAQHIFNISDGLFAELQPIESGVTNAPFFNRGKHAFVVPSTEVHIVSVPLPKELEEFYAKYPSTVEFSMRCGDWTFLSEREIKSRYNIMCAAGQTRLVDFALRYMGMGHIETCGYDPVTNTVFTVHDGGSNEWDRANNLESKVSLDVDTVPRLSFQEWWRSETTHASTSDNEECKT